MESLYNVYFAGELLEGHERGSVREKLGKLFNADEATLNKLFSGKPQLLKRECDKATALKYQQAIERAGAKPVIQIAQTAPSTTAPGAKAAAPKPNQTMSAAERIAALAQAPDKGGYTPGPVPTVKAHSAAEPNDGIHLAEVGTEVLRPSERAGPIVRNIDTSGLVLDDHTDRLAAEPPSPPPAPDTAHLSMANVGEDIPTLPCDTVPLRPNTDALDLSPAGTDFSDCAIPEAQAPDLDLSKLNVAPEGAELLEDEYRDKHTTVGPNTDHISLQE